MKSNFAAAVSLVLQSEGGYVDNPKDPGGATNLGITLATLSAWRGKTVSKADVKALTKAEVTQIYKARYWDVVHGDDLPAGVDYAVFDYGVNSGPGTAVKALQRVLGVTVDGVVGPITVAAARKSPTGAIRALCDQRMVFLQSLRTWPTFGVGWTRRVAAVRASALVMVDTPPQSTAQPYRPLPAPTPLPPKPAAPQGIWPALWAAILNIFYALKGLRK